MTTLARDLLRRIVRPSETAAVRTAEVVVAVPEAVTGGLADALADAIRSIAGNRAAEAGIERTIVVRSTSGSRGAVEIALSGRPLALIEVGEPGDPQWLTRVATAVERALVRRRSLLLDESLTWAHAERLARMTDDLRIDRYEPVPALLLDAGISLRERGKVEFGVSPRSCSAPSEIAEAFIDAYAPTILEVEVPDRLLRSTASGGEAMSSARHDLYDRAGLELPDVALRWSGTDPGCICATFNDVRLLVTRIGADSTWPMAVEAVTREAERYGDWFVRLRDLDRVLHQFAQVVPDLISVSSRRYSTAMLTAVLRALLANGSSIRNVPRILLTLIDADLPPDRPDGVRFSTVDPADAPADISDPDVIASTVRRRTVEDGWMTRCVPDARRSVSVPPEVESALRLPPGSGARNAAEWRLVRHVHTLEPPVTIVTSTPGAIAAVRYALKALPTPWHVIASQELPAVLPMPPVMTGGRSAVVVPLAGHSPTPGAYPLA